MKYYGFKSVAKFPRSNLKNLGFANGMAQVIKSLFANNEQGFAFDFNDLSTMYQDAAGTVPVTGVGQPVGLVLDKSKGLVLGANRVQNGDFNDSSNWVVGGADATHNITFSNGTVRYQSDTITPVLNLSQANILEIGKWYEVIVNCSKLVSGSLKIDTTTASVPIVTKEGINKGYILASGTSLVLVRNSANVDLTIDSITVKELPGNHATQSTSAKRPILQQNATTGAYYLSFDGVDDCLVTGNINFNATNKISIFTGITKKSDATNGVLLEFSTNSYSTQSSFGLLASFNSSLKNYAFRTCGSLLSESSTNAYAAPHTTVSTAKASISDDLNELRINGIKTATSSQDQGTGNYGNYPLYIGMRAGTSLPFTGNLYSLIGVARIATDNEITNAENAIAKNVGVTL